MTIWDCRTHVRMTSMTSSVERTDLDFKISVALIQYIYTIQMYEKCNFVIFSGILEISVATSVGNHDRSSVGIS